MPGCCSTCAERANLSDPLVSVVIPLFNKGPWIIQTLLTVLGQTYSNWECLIIDDGSTDGSLETVNSFIESHPGNWKIISQVNLGQTHARNLGIEKASGDFIAFLDADDLWLPNKLELQVKTHLSNPEIALSMTSYVIFKKGQKNNFRIVTCRDSKKMISRWFSLTGFGGLIESTGFLKKETLEIFGNYSESFSMTAGLDLSLKIVSELKVIVLREPLVLYRLSPGQFHKHENILVRDLEHMSTKYAKNPGELARLQKLHASYLYWSNCRNRGAKYFGLATLRTIFLLDRGNFPMLYYLLSRNGVALFRGFKQRNRILEFLNNTSVK